jgi:uncharacterized protein
VSSIFGLLLFLLLISLVLHVVARVMRVDVADESCQRRPWLPTHWREPLEEGEEVRFETHDGAILSGTLLHRLTENCRGTIVYSHELNGDRWNALAYVEHLRAEGFDVFTFDYRNHGRSESQCRWDNAFDVTETDTADLRAAIGAAVAKSSQMDPVVAIVGAGKGAAIALSTAGEEPAVRGLLLDSVQPLPGTMDSSHRDAGTNSWCQFVKRFFHRTDAHPIDVAQAAADVRVPVLLVHGRSDVRVSLDAVRTLASQIAGQCQLWVVPGARHAEAVHVDRNAYRQRSVKFLTHALQTKPAAAPAPSHKPTAPVAHHGRVSSAPAQ